MTPITVKVGKLKGKAYTREEYRFKKAHPFRWWLGSIVKKFSLWVRRTQNKDLYIKKIK